MGRSLVIVESPAKVKTLKHFLGDGYTIQASMGHVRDLPKTKMGVDVEHGFTPTYRPLPEKSDVLKKLGTAAKKADKVILATDPDREGEAIAWHLAQALGIADPVRIEFNEITEGAVREALERPRAIDLARVNAQQARRILDRLVGYELSPLISRKVRRRGLSAGRVQSVALRLVVEREREIRAFVPREYWSVLAELSRQGEDARFEAVTPYTKSERMSLADEGAAQAVVDAVAGCPWIVRSVRRQTRRRRPRPPFTTSTLQQSASGRLGFSASRTMAIAQALYEGKELGGEEAAGLITYMRTDSVRVASVAQAAARDVIARRYGEAYLPPRPPVYRSRRAQDAHEAIRPTSVERTPESVAAYLSPEERGLYELIWQRFVASQMADAVFEVMTVDIEADGHTFRASGSRLEFAGWLAVLAEPQGSNGEGRPDEQNGDDAEQEPSQGYIPELREGQELDLRKLTARQHFTQPPPRYTEAALIAELEERGIGRPSTYAPTVEVIRQRRYVELVEKRFVPTPIGETVHDLLVAHFPDIVDVDFTARMEERLDSVEDGALDWQALLSEFYGGFSETVERAHSEMEERLIEVGEQCPECGKPLVLRRGRNGDFTACSGYPGCSYVKREQAEPVEVGENCPECGKPLLRRKGRYGPFVGCSGYPDCKYVQKRARQSEKPEGIGVRCLEAKCDGEIVQRRARQGDRVFYGCSRYPRCRFTSSYRPVGRACPEDGGHLVWRPAREGADGLGMIVCSRKGCKHSEPLTEDLVRELGLEET